MSTRLPFKPRFMPPVLSRGFWWIMGLTLVCVLLAQIWVASRDELGVPRGFIYRYAPFVAVIPHAVFWPWWILRRRSIRRALRSSHGRLCTHCTYDVSKLAPSGTCPECGKPYDIARDAHLWNSFLGSNSCGADPQASQPQASQPQASQPHQLPPHPDAADHPQTRQRQ
jgi:hypothetical protein